MFWAPTNFWRTSSFSMERKIVLLIICSVMTFQDFHPMKYQWKLTASPQRVRTREEMKQKWTLQGQQWPEWPYSPSCAFPTGTWYDILSKRQWLDQCTWEIWLLLLGRVHAGGMTQGIHPWMASLSVVWQTQDIWGLERIIKPKQVARSS